MQNFVPRWAWGARPPKDPPVHLPAVSIRGAALHYTAMNADEQSDHKNCAGRVRGIQNYHMDHNGWNDIAYSYVYCKHGFIFEGRGFGVRTAAQGTNWGNDHFHAYCFLGDDTAGKFDLGAGGRRALVNLVRAGWNEYPAGQEILPHRSFSQTRCPGDEIAFMIVSAPWKRKLPVRPIDWKWARWYLGIGEYKQFGRRAKGKRPLMPNGKRYPRRIPVRGWRAVRWYKKRLNL